MFETVEKVLHLLGSGLFLGSGEFGSQKVKRESEKLNFHTSVTQLLKGTDFIVTR